MTTDQITFHVQPGGPGAIATVATSLLPEESRTWRRLLDPYLPVGSPLGRGYLDFGARAAAIRWQGDVIVSLAWEYAHAYVGENTELTVRQALELPDLNPADIPGGGLIPVEV